jgi:hypothetical protein
MFDDGTPNPIFAARPSNLKNVLSYVLELAWLRGYVSGHPVAL